jgi:hypothetical protein
LGQGQRCPKNQRSSGFSSSSLTNGVVLERRVGRLERVLELVALEHVVVPARLGARTVVRVDGAPDGPESSGLALDPDDDALLAALIVHACEDAFGEAAFR